MRQRRVATDEFRERVQAGLSARLLAEEFKMSQGTAARLKAEVLADNETDDDLKIEVEDLGAAYTISFDVLASKLDEWITGAEHGELLKAVLMLHDDTKANVLSNLMHRRANPEELEVG
jgi:hypothetical protein